MNLPTDLAMAVACSLLPAQNATSFPYSCGPTGWSSICGSPVFGSSGHSLWATSGLYGGSVTFGVSTTASQCATSTLAVLMGGLQPITIPYAMPSGPNIIGVVPEWFLPMRVTATPGQHRQTFALPPAIVGMEFYYQAIIAWDDNLTYQFAGTGCLRVRF